MGVCIHIYLYIYKILVLKIQPEKIRVYTPGERLAFLLIVFATSVSLPYDLCSLRETGWSKASSVCCSCSSWLRVRRIFFMPHFGALSAVLPPPPFFCPMMLTLHSPPCVAVTFACILCLTCSIWRQNARSKHFHFANYSLFLPTWYIGFLLFLAAF